MALARMPRTRWFRMSAVCTAALLSGMGPAWATVNSLEEALVAAYTGNPTLLAQRAALRATDEGVAQAVSGWRPTVTASASYTYADTDGERSSVSAPTAGTFLNEAAVGADLNNNGNITDSFVITPPTPGGEVFTSSIAEVAKTTQYQVSAQQQIFAGFRTFNEYRRAKANVRAGRAELQSTEQTVLLDTITAYMDVLRDEAVLRLSQNNVQVLDRQLEAAQDRFRVGEITRTDVAQAEARLSGAQANLIASEAQLTVSRAAFERVIGDKPGDLSSPPLLPPVPESEAAALAIALDNNPSLRAAKEAEKAAGHAVSVAKGALLPTLSVQGAYVDSDTTSEPGGQSVFTGDRNSVTKQVVAQLDVPLYQAGSEYSQIRQSKQLRSQARLQIAEAERLVAESVATAWEGLRSARSTIASSAEQVRANEIAFEGVQQEAQVGSRTTLDVLDAEQELLDSRVTLVRAERDEYVAAFQLLSTIGSLTAQDLNMNVAYYDPDVHYDDVKGQWLGWWSKDE